MTDDTAQLIDEARNGDRRSLETLIRGQQDRVHRLAVRMMADPEAAADATQDILIRVVTHLGSFKGDARFDTWVYRIAVNHLLSARKILARDPGLSFDAFGADLRDGLVDDTQAAPETHVLLNELRQRCTMAMLLCLDRDQRAAYVLGDVLELDHREAAEVLELAPATYRKRLSRARTMVQEFTAHMCGLASADAACSCPRRLPAAMKCGRMPETPSQILAGAPDYDTIKRKALRTERTLVAACLQRGTGPLNSPLDHASDVLTLLDRQDATG